jgi:lipid-A-disaccharide synthase
MANTLDQLLTILPFEKNYFSGTPLKVEFVGHPLIKKIEHYPYQKLPFPEERRIIGVFPGSREKELLRNFPQHLTVIKRLLQDDPTCFFAISISDLRFHSLLKEMIHNEGLNLEQDITLLSPQYTYDLMQSAEIAIAKSGTVTLELALHEVPTVVTYGISTLDLFIARDLLRIRLPFYCLVNIIGEKEIFPELFGPNFTSETLYKKAKEFLFDSAKQQNCRKLCKELRLSMGNNDATCEAAKRVLNLFRS